MGKGGGRRVKDKGKRVKKEGEEGGSGQTLATKEGKACRFEAVIK